MRALGWGGRMILLVTLLVVGGASMVRPASAFGGSVWSGRAFGTGDYNNRSYFENGWYDSFRTVYGGPPGSSHVIHGGIWGVSDVDGFISFLKAKYANTSPDPYSASSRAGAAFVVHTLLGRSGDQANAVGGRDALRASDFEDVRSRLKAASINWGAWVCTYGRTTMSVVSDNRQTYDVQRDRAAYYNGDNECGEGLVITDRYGSQYVIQRKCVNPIGDISGIARADFDLSSTITVSPQVAESRTLVQPAGTVTNGGAVATPSGVQYRAVTFRVAPGAAIPQQTGGVSSLAPEAYYGNGATLLATNAQIFQKGATQVALPVQEIGEYEVGTRLCYALSVQPRRYDDVSWYHSAPACVVVAKKPKVQVLGGDLWVGRGGVANVQTSLSVQSQRGVSSVYGSWVEYGAVVSGSVKGLATASGYASARTNSSLCEVSLLTVTSAGGGACEPSLVGYYKSVTQARSISSRFWVDDSTPRLIGTVDSAALAHRVYTAASQSTITLRASRPMAKGAWAVINAPGADVIIASDLTYTSELLGSAGDIPQLVIIARNIIIANNVGRIDAWLIATGSGADGRVNTCGAGGVSETTTVTAAANNCAAALRVNGPVIAHHLLLRRTAGAGPSEKAGEPAETFNLRPDAYLWATQYAAHQGRLQVVEQRELPVRW